MVARVARGLAWADPKTISMDRDPKFRGHVPTFRRRGSRARLRPSPAIGLGHRQCGRLELVQGPPTQLFELYALDCHDSPQHAINPSRREAFSALQFQDISDQLLAHAQARLAMLQQEVDLLMGALQPGNHQEDVVARLTTLVEQANDNLADLDISLLKPVGKAHLGTGDAEMF